MTRLDAYRRIVGEPEPRFRVTRPGREDRMESIYPRLVKAFWASQVPAWCEAGVVRKAPVRLVRKGRR